MTGDAGTEKNHVHQGQIFLPVLHLFQQNPVINTHIGKKKKKKKINKKKKEKQFTEARLQDGSVCVCISVYLE